MFCKGGFSKVKDFLSKVTPQLENIIHQTTEWTGKIKALEADPTVDAIEQTIPAASTLVGYANKAIDIIVGIEQNGLSLAAKISDWLSGLSETARDANLVKLAQVTTAVQAQAEGASQETHQSFYDTAVQVHIEGLK